MHTLVLCPLARPLVPPNTLDFPLTRAAAKPRVAGARPLLATVRPSTGVHAAANTILPTHARLSSHTAHRHSDTATLAVFGE